MTIFYINKCKKIALCTIKLFPLQKPLVANPTQLSKCFYKSIKFNDASF